MSWRIEEADALVLLRELPDGWAQTCVTRPPRGGTASVARGPRRGASRAARRRHALASPPARAAPLPVELARSAGPTARAEVVCRHSRCHGGGAAASVHQAAPAFFLRRADAARDRPRGLCARKGRQGAACASLALPRVSSSCGWRSSGAACWRAPRRSRAGCAAPRTGAPAPVRAPSHRRATCAHNDQSGAALCSTLLPPGSIHRRGCPPLRPQFPRDHRALRIGERR